LKRRRRHSNWYGFLQVAARRTLTVRVRAALEAYPVAQLQTTLRLAREKSRFYRQRLAEALPELTCLADLPRFPFTTAQDIRGEAVGIYPRPARGP
jgi:phenylacetate-coenzyme A ligase PaaK-like adenylate-forming protein